MGDQLYEANSSEEYQSDEPESPIRRRIADEDDEESINRFDFSQS